MITGDVKTDQRLLNLAGYGAGKVDGIAGSKTWAAWEKWQRDMPDLGGLDERSARNVRTLLPEVQVLVRDWLLGRAYEAARALGYGVKVICGTRDWAEQDALYAKGRTAPGARVTNAKGGSSRHNYGVAWDVGLFTASGAYVEHGGAYKSFAEAAGIPAGVEWGGSWKSLKDYPHYQWVGKYGTLAVLKANCQG